MDYPRECVRCGVHLTRIHQFDGDYFRIDGNASCADCYARYIAALRNWRQPTPSTGIIN